MKGIVPCRSCLLSTGRNAASSVSITVALSCQTDGVTGLQAVRRFARATNLVVAGRRFRIIGNGPDAEDLFRILTTLGSREADAGGDRVDHLWCTGSSAESTAAVREIATRQPGAPLIVIDAGSAAPALELDALGPLRPVRAGVVALSDVSEDLYAVTRSGNPAAWDPATDADARIAWAQRFMPVSTGLAAKLGQAEGLYGLRFAVAMVLEPKTAVLALLLRDAGAVVDVYAHADETDDEVASALRRKGLDVFASSTATLAEQRDLALELLDRRPDILLDDGSHVIRLAHELRPAVLDTMIGAAEETTSGLRPLRAMAERGELRLPVIAVNDALTKTFFDNRYGTGQSCVFAILDLLDAAPADVRERVTQGGRAVVAGFGHVGEGVARALSAAGIRVVISERDPVRALQAAFAGYDVAPLREAVRQADLVVSATGVRNTISLEVLRACAPGAVVAVAGGVDQEVAVDDTVAAGATRDTVAPKIERFRLDDGHDVIVLDDGGCINITAGEGNPIEIMDLSFAVQLEAVRTLLDGSGRLGPELHPVHGDTDRRIAAAALDTLGLRSDDDTGVDETSGRPLNPAPLDTRTTRFGPLTSDGDAQDAHGAQDAPAERDAR
ncbi:MAG: hypothetical protein JWP75_2577 [Frondihabitans sp.]|nr:hypothetical protein [Frondihabitans sp.]